MRYGIVKNVNLLYDGNGINILNCPSCGGRNLHQVNSKIIFRNEDSDCIEYKIDKKSISEKKIKNEKLSGRRDSLNVCFECEECNGIKRLVIMQHKGETHIFFDNTQRKY